MQKESKLIQNLCIGVIIICVLVVGYIFLKPNGQTIGQNQNTISDTSLVEGKQVIKMTVFADRYDPEYFTVKAGIPVRWEITSSGQPGCASGAIIAKGLVSGDQIYLNPQQGQVTVAEFTPQNPGVYRYNCPMNMIRGKIVVE